MHRASQLVELPGEASVEIRGRHENHLRDEHIKYACRLG